MTDVKVCGLTRAEDVESACELGARYVGFNFSAGSPRRIELETAREVAAHTPHGIPRVGVFVHETPDEIRRAADAARLDLLQIHRPLREEDLALPLPVVAYFGVDASGRIGGTRIEVASRCPAAIVDTAMPGIAGGTGRTFDWSSLDRWRSPVPMWLAGGLGPDNVGDAIARVHPAVVDVASGVESAPGIKDRARLESFFRAVRRADRGVGRDAETA